MIVPTLDLAIEYLLWNPGHFLFPIAPGKKTPPLIEDNLKKASDRFEQITEWHNRWPGCGWGLALKLSHMIVVDVDTKPGKNGQLTYDMLDLEYGWPKTQTVMTPSGGMHLYYSGEHFFALGKHGFGEDVDSPNYVLIAGCTLADGSAYRRVPSPGIAAAPAWFAEHVRRPEVRGERDDAAVVDLDKPGNVEWASHYLANDAPPAIQGKGGEKQTLLIAMTLREHGISESHALDLMLKFYNDRCDPPWDVEGNDGIKKKISNGYEYASQAAPGEKTPEAEFMGDALPPETEDDRVETNKRKAKIKKADLALGDFVAYLPEHRYIYKATGALWPSESVNARVKKGANGILDRQHAVHCMAWCPGLPMIVRNRLAIEGGWIEKEGTATFNRYQPARYIPGDSKDIAKWRDHLHRIYPAEADHIEHWLAYRVQKPNIKINHALVLGGPTRIGKDTSIEPLKVGVGAWNVKEITANQAMDNKNNGFLEAVVLRISEARDFGDTNRYAFYDHLKPWLASPPDVLSVSDKYVKAHACFNLVGIVITTNYKTNGIYLPPDDARHYVAWSDSVESDFPKDYFVELWDWYNAVGLVNVATFLNEYDLGNWNPKAPPPKTPAFYEIVNANNAPEHDDLGCILDTIGRPDVLTVDQVIAAASGGDSALSWADSKNRRQIPRQMEAVGYVSVRNTSEKEGRWMVNGKRIAIYGRAALSIADRIGAARNLQRATVDPLS